MSEAGVKQFFTFAHGADQMTLECGACFGPVTLAYETYGSLSPQKDNAILVLHAFSGDSHVASHDGPDEEARGAGWWEFMVGPGKGIDTRKYFVICVNILGGCMGSTGPASENPATKQCYGLDFPVFFAFAA